MDIAAWLRGLGLERYEPVFRKSEIDSEVLPELTEGDLERLGLPLGPRKKVLKAIADLRGQPTAPSAETAPYPRAVATDAERRQLTVMFVDLVGSTELSAKLDPEDMGEVIRAYQDCCADVIKLWNGYLAQYVGDGVLAYFGWPKAQEDDAERAVRAGLALVQAVARLTTDDRPLAARIGIATGLVVVGDPTGEGAGQEQAVVGDTPNLAARLQTLAMPGSVVISQATRRLLGDLFELTDLGPTRLKGFAEPLAVFRVEGEGHAEGRFEALHGQLLTPLVGREPELAMLMERWTRAREGEGQVVLITGEAGIGKSRLLRAFREQLGGEPHVTLSHFCSPYHTNSALHPVIVQLERAARLTAEDDAGDRLAKLAALLGRATARLDEAVPLIAALLGVRSDQRYPALSLSPQQQKQRTLEVLIEQLAGLARDRRVLELYEDLHWADPSTLELLDLLVERVRALPVLAVLTYRPEFNPPWTGQAHVTALTMNRLGRRQGAVLVDRVTGGKALPSEILDQILARTDGVPLFVEELTKTVLELGLLTEAGDRYELSGPLPPLAIPSSLQDSLMARLDRLAPVKEVAQIGATIGREFSHALLAAVADRPDPELREGLDQLVAAGLIFRRGTPPDATYSFKHSLVQDAAYHGLLRSRRQQLHARIAKILEERFEETADREPELVAHHYTEAHDAKRAVGYWHKAGQRAAQRSANIEAVAHLRKAVEALETLPNSSTRDQQELDLQIALGSPLIVTKGYSAPEVEQAYLRAQVLSRRVGDVSQLFIATWGLWIINLTRMQLKTARRLADELLGLARRQTDPAYFLQASHATWTTCLYLPELSACADQADQGVALYDRDQHRSHKFLYGGHDPGVCAGNYRALSRWLLGFPDQAVAQAEKAVALARDSAHLFSLILALTFSSFLRHFRREAGLARELAQAVTSCCTEQGTSPHYLATAGIVRGWADVHQTSTLQGIAEIRHGLDQLAAMRVNQRRSYYLGILAEAYGSVDEPEQGLSALSRAAAFMAETGEGWWGAEIHRLKGELLLHRSSEGQGEADASFRTALNTARHQGSRSLELRAATSLARLWVDQGKRVEAHDLLAPVHGWFTEGFDTADLEDAKALLDDLR